MSEPELIALISMHDRAVAEVARIAAKIQAEIERRERASLNQK